MRENKESRVSDEFPYIPISYLSCAREGPTETRNTSESLDRSSARWVGVFDILGECKGHCHRHTEHRFDCQGDYGCAPEMSRNCGTIHKLL